ncbi:glycosyltransferase family 4 protein [Thermodesulfobacteriota bacterium]
MCLLLKRIPVNIDETKRNPKSYFYQEETHFHTDMRILYYMPFKSLGHSTPSGDLVIGTELHDFLTQRGHQLDVASRLRTRWIFLKPWLWSRFFTQRARAIRLAQRKRAHLWMTYHTYYKSPDILGPSSCRRLKIPYVIFQGIYATKIRRRLKTLPGFILNRRALVSADFVFANKKIDYTNLLRIVPPDRLQYVRPGIIPREFFFDENARKEIRGRWGVQKVPVVMAAAMFRPGVKTRGLVRVINACGNLYRQGIKLYLVLAGDGQNREYLEALADDCLRGNVRFLGKIPRRQLYRFYSAADVFAFPGIEESLGMAYLEAQSCGLPAVALNDWGAKEAIVHNRTGLLSGENDRGGFERNIARLIQNPSVRIKMGKAAAAHVAQYHDLEKNYTAVETVLHQLAGQKHLDNTKNT